MNSDKEFLYNLIQKKEQQYERKKINRFIITVLCFSLIFFYLFYLIMNNGLIESVFISLFFGFFYVIINFYIFNYLIYKSDKENLELERLKQKYTNLNN